MFHLLYSYGLSVRKDRLKPSTSRPFTLLPFETDAEAIEAQLARAVGDLRVVGGSDEIVGRVRVLSSHVDWKAKFGRLASASSNIFVLPTTGTGTLWEIAWLKDQGLLKKTIFLMRSSDIAPENLEALWNESRDQLLSSTGLDFPLYDGKGAIFTINAFDRMTIYPSKGFSVHAIKQAIWMVSSLERRLKINKISIYTDAAAIAVIFLIAWFLFSQDFYGPQEFLAAIGSPYFVAAGCLCAANVIACTKFTFSQITGAGTIWFVCLILWAAIGGDWGLTGNIDGINGTFWELFPIHNRVLINAVIFFAIVSLTLARFSFRTVLTMTTRQAMRAPIAWVSTSVALALVAKLFPEDMLIDPELIVWTGSAFAGGLTWLRAIASRTSGSTLADVLGTPAGSNV
ncbi:hypothetical protein [Mesorhizobium sp. M0977]|uniref:hypothetical protein n=1 Tax=Mesorhizobium sp. M0977 TaxID=2957039 RepID=UPI00333CD3C9